MNELKCYIVQDMLPLYIDNAVSKESKIAIEKHLSTCEGCTRELDITRKDLIIPIETDIAPFKIMKRKLLNKKIIISAVSILLTMTICFCGFWFINYHESIIPYETSSFSIEEVNDSLFVNYIAGQYHIGSVMYLENKIIDGKAKNVALIHFSQTLYTKGKSIVDTSIIDKFALEIKNIDKLDAIYYGDSSLAFKDNTKTSGYNYESVFEHAVLIWGQ